MSPTKILLRIPFLVNKCYVSLHWNSISQICKITAPQCPEMHSVNRGSVNSCFLSSSWNMQSEKLSGSFDPASSRIQNAKWLVRLRVATSATPWGADLHILMQQGPGGTSTHMGHRLWRQPYCHPWPLFCLLLCSNQYLYFVLLFSSCGRVCQLDD